MPASDGTISLALDLDGSLVEKDVTPLRWRPKAKEFVLAASAAGFKLWLYSCRCAIACVLVDAEPWDADDFWRSGRASPDVEKSLELFEEMRSFLVAEGVWHLMTAWTAPGKPFADFICDDRSELPDWGRLAQELGLPLGHAYPGTGRQDAEPVARPALPQPASTGGGRPAVPAEPPAAT